MVGVLIIVAIMAFSLIHMAPGDPARVLAGDKGTEERVEKIRHQLGLDKPLHTQFLSWVRKLFTNELRSIYSRRPVMTLILYKLPVTASIAMGAFVVCLIIGFPLGLISAVHEGTWIDRLGVVIATIGVSAPSFWIGMNLIVVFAIYLHWLPSCGFVHISESFLGWLRSITLPALSLGFAQAALVTRMTRSSVLEVLNDDYVRTARAKGLEEKIVLLKHVVRNAMITIVTVIGLVFALLMGGAVVTEQVFTIPGLGRLIIEAVTRRDYPTVQGVVLFIAFFFTAVNLMVDLLYAFLDPRIKYS
jgi:peptide/nickel transport system permease protein